MNRAVAQAREAAARGWVVPHERVRDWLLDLARVPHASSPAGVKVVWSDLAPDDVELPHDYLRPFNLSAAQQIAEDLVLAGDGLATFPRRGRPGMTVGTRELTIVRPYVVIYEITGDQATSLRVWHTAQDRS